MILIDLSNEKRRLKNSNLIPQPGKFSMLIGVNFWMVIDNCQTALSCLILNCGTNPKLRSKAKSKTKFTCSECGANAWGKPELKIVCADCDEPMIDEAR